MYTSKQDERFAALNIHDADSACGEKRRFKSHAQVFATNASRRQPILYYLFAENFRHNSESEQVIYH